MAYLVYENRVVNKAIIHDAACSHVKKNGGVSLLDPPTGWYYEGFKTAEAAIEKARSTGRPFRQCGFCRRANSN